MNKRLKEISYVLLGLIHKVKSPETAGTDMLVIAPGVGDAFLWADAIRKITASYEESGRKIIIVCGSAAKYFYTEILGIKESFFSEECISMNHEENFNVVEKYRDKVFNTIIITCMRDVIAAGLNAKRKVYVNSRLEYNSRNAFYRTLLNHAYDHKELLPMDCWMGNRINMALKQLGIEPEPSGVSQLNYITEKIIDKNIIPETDYVIITCETTNIHRRWPKDRFIALARDLREKYGYDVYFTGVEKDEALEMLAAENSGIKCLCGKSDFKTYLSIIGNSKFVVGVDSAIIHIAAALGVQAFAITGCMEVGKYFPYTPEEVSPDNPLPLCISDGIDRSCKNCLQNKKLIKKRNINCYRQIYETPGGVMECLENVEKEAVLEAIDGWRSPLRTGGSAAP